MADFFIHWPWGTLCARLEAGQLCELLPLRPTAEQLPSQFQAEEDSSAAALLQNQIDAWAAGQLKEFTIPLKPKGSSFQHAVWEAARQIPYGQTRTYGQLAAALGKAGGARAVGNALGANPILLLIPCHRILAANGKLGGFSAGLDLKRCMLAREDLEKPT